MPSPPRTSESNADEQRPGGREDVADGLHKPRQPRGDDHRAGARRDQCQRQREAPAAEAEQDAPEDRRGGGCEHHAQVPGGAETDTVAE